MGKEKPVTLLNEAGGFEMKDGVYILLDIAVSNADRRDQAS